jgi:hypothetical protein
MPRVLWANPQSPAVLATKHGKEAVVGSILGEEFALEVAPAPGLDTDRFGTFSREIERRGSPLDAARLKIAAGFDLAPQAQTGLASEGSFGPHPHVPFLAIGRELVLMVDRASGSEIVGHDVTADTNFSHSVVRDVEEALNFARRVGFPAHGLIVMGCLGEQPAPRAFIARDLSSDEALAIATRTAIGCFGAAFVETDMRAHRNPTRMASIGRATRDLVRRFRTRCPSCGHPGFDVTERIAGLPCEWCGQPTRVVMIEVATCQACSHRLEQSASTGPKADPAWCDLCNP